MILYRHPDDDGGGGKKKEEEPPTGDAAAAQEIGALKHQLETAQKRAEELDSLKANVGALFNPNATEEQRQEALSRVMVTGGISEQDVQTMVKEIMGGEGEAPPAPQQQQQQQVTPPVEPTGDDKPNPLEDKIQELSQQIQSMQNEGAQAKQAQSKEALQAAVSNALATSPDAKQLMERLSGARGKEHAEKVADLLRKDVLRETLENLYSRKAQVGQFNPAWITEEATKAAEATLEKAKALMVTDSVGKAPGVLDEAVMLSELAKRELKTPAYDKDKTRAENTDAVDNWTVQRLQQMAAIHAAKAAAGGESKA